LTLIWLTFKLANPELRFNELGNENYRDLLEFKFKEHIKTIAVIGNL